MTVVDLHPEDLLQKDALSDLDPGERARLDAHLARCATCRFERQLRVDFAEDMRTEIPLPMLAGLEASALEHDAKRGASVPGRARSKRSSRLPRTIWLFGAAAALVAMSVAASESVRGGVWHELLGSLIAPTPGPLKVEPPAASPRKTAPPSNPLPVDDVPVPLVVDAPQPLAPALEAVVENRAAAPVPLPSLPAVAALQDGRGPERQVAPPSAPVRASSASPVLGVAALFDEESEARRHGDYPRVLDLHRELEARFPASREAQASRATVGRLMLDRGDAGSALANFDAYLAAGAGDLREEAMIGRSIALDRLARPAEARGAWEALLAAFPSTPYATHAKARIASSKSPY